MSSPVTVPVDMYDAPTEMVIVMPLGGVKKESVKLTLIGSHLKIVGTREKPTLKASLSPRQEQCFRGLFEKEVMLPTDAAVDRIWSEISPENILMVVIPKIVQPEEIVVNIK